MAPDEGNSISSKNRNAGTKMFFLFFFVQLSSHRVHNVKILNRNFLFYLFVGNSFERQGKLIIFTHFATDGSIAVRESGKSLFRKFSLFSVMTDELSIVVTDSLNIHVKSEFRH